MKTDQWLKGTFSLVRTMSNVDKDNETPIRIELNDGLSGTRQIDIKISKDEFVDALFGKGYAECVFRLIGVELAGMKTIHNAVFIDVGSYGRDCIPEAMVKLAPLVDEGWSYREDDLRNGHNFSKNPNGEGWVVKVHTWKHVEPDSAEAKEWEAAQIAKEKLREAEREERAHKRKGKKS